MSIYLTYIGKRLSVRMKEGKMTAENLKIALRRLIRSVVVVTASHQGRPHAMAATAVSEVSLDPPSMLVCVNRQTNMFTVLDSGAPLALNILSADHEEVSRACGGDLRGSDRFSVGDWQTDLPDRPPVLRDACAVILLEQAQKVDHGTHRVIIGNVTEILLPQAPRPLAYYDGAYHPVSSAA